MSDKNDSIKTSENEEFVDRFIQPLGVSSKIVQAFRETPRHLFVSKPGRTVYQDIALSIGEGQTISQPSLVALMTDFLNLKGDERVLEIGTGSGFQAAILSKLAKKVYTIEIIPSLERRARKALKQIGCTNVSVFLSDGREGLKQYSPFDVIIVTAASETIPDELKDQLKEGGRIVIPVGKEFNDQKLKLGVKTKGKLVTKELEDVRFVPLVFSKNK